MHLIKFSNVIDDDDDVKEITVNANSITQFYLLPNGNTVILGPIGRRITVAKDIVSQLTLALKTIENGSFRQIGGEK